MTDALTMTAIAGAGQAVRERVAPETFRIVFLLGLLGLGGHLIVRGII